MDEEQAIVIGSEGGQHVLIRPLWRSHPKETDYWDGNWIESEVKLRVGGFRGSYRASLRAEDFAGFRNELATLTETLSGVARFCTMEEQLELELKGDDMGHVRVNGKALDDAGIGNVLEFTFEIDQTYLPELTRSVESVMSRFPVVGSPDA